MIALHYHICYQSGWDGGVHHQGLPSNPEQGSPHSYQARLVYPTENPIAANQLAQHPAVNLLPHYSTSIEYQIPWQAKVYTMKINCRFNYRNKESSSRNLCSRWLPVIPETKKTLAMKGKMMRGPTLECNAQRPQSVCRRFNKAQERI